MERILWIFCKQIVVVANILLILELLWSTNFLSATIIICNVDNKMQSLEFLNPSSLGTWIPPCISFALPHGSSHFPSLFFPSSFTFLPFSLTFFFLPKHSLLLFNSALLFDEGNWNGHSVVQARSSNRRSPCAPRSLRISITRSYLRLRSPHSFAWVTKFNALRFLFRISPKRLLALQVFPMRRWNWFFLPWKIWGSRWRIAVPIWWSDSAMRKTSFSNLQQRLLLR